MNTGHATNIINWERGYQDACGQYLAGDITDVEAALHAFCHDPADSDYQHGYFAGLMALARRIEA